MLFSSNALGVTVAIFFSLSIQYTSKALTGVATSYITACGNEMKGYVLSPQMWKPNLGTRHGFINMMYFRHHSSIMQASQKASAVHILH